MNRDEFTALPLSTALGLLWDVLPEGARAALEDLPTIQPARSPKYDRVIFVRDGLCWASECAAKELQYHYDRAQKGALNPDSKWAEKDGKQAAALRRWLEWRRIEPLTVWSGERNDKRVTAAPPSDRPTVYDKSTRGGGSAPASDDPIPF